MADRAARQRLIADLVSRGTVENQEVLRQLLANRGVDAAQATLSRDLREMGVVKGPGGYSLPGRTPVAPTWPIESRALSAYVLEVRQGGTMVVIKTGPGQAPPVAAELDAAQPEGLLGTVAGDDTVMAAARTEHHARVLATHVRKLAGLGAHAGNGTAHGMAHGTAHAPARPGRP